MKYVLSGIVVSIFASAALAQESRELDAHMHGVTKVQIATEGNSIEINLEAPGADVVGFEYAAESDADKAAVAEAIAQLVAVERVIVLDPAGECSLEDARAELHGSPAADDAHGEGEGKEDGHDHAHNDDAEKDEAGHSAFEAHYHFDCANAQAVSEISFPFFQTFPNAQEIEAEFVTEEGAGASEVTRDKPKLTLKVR